MMLKFLRHSSVVPAFILLNILHFKYCHIYTSFVPLHCRPCSQKTYSLGILISAMTKIKPRWFRDIHSEQKGEVGEAVAKAYILEQIRKKPDILYPDFANCEIHVYDSQGDNRARITIKYADTGENIKWVPDFHVQIKEKISREERSRRRDEDDENAQGTISRKNLYAEVKTSKSRSYPSDTISQNQTEAAEYLARQEDTVVIGVMITLRKSGIRIHTYRMTENGEWKKVQL